MLLPLASIRTDGGTQPRAAIDFAAVDDYMDAMLEGIKFPPVTVFYDGADYWLADGFHRVTAALQADLKEIAADVHQGTREDAQWYSFSANKANGLRRSNEDKQRAVKAALGHPKSAGMSDNQIAKHIGVAQHTVSDWRKKIGPLSKSLSETEQADSVSNKRERVCSDGRVMNTANIGRKPAPSFEGGTRFTREAPEPRETASLAQSVERPICGGNVAGSTPAAGSNIVPITPTKQTKRQRLDALAQMTVDLIETAKRLARLTEWLEDEGRLDEAEAALTGSISAMRLFVTDIEQAAVQADPLNRGRLSIGG